MPNSTPSIVLLGKCRNPAKHYYVHDLLRTSTPEVVLVEFLHCVYIVTDDQDKFRVSSDMFQKKVIRYRDLVDDLAKLGIDTFIDKIEIVLDMDKVQARVEEETDELMAILC